MTYVILDTTALFTDRRLEHPEAQALLAASRAGELVVVLPEVVLRETIGHHRREVASLLDQVEGLQKKLQRRGVAVLTEGIDPIDLVLERLEHVLYDRILNAKGQIAAIP